MMNWLIVAVVCCVVGTSLVWVIIIYQTRRNKEYRTNSDSSGSRYSAVPPRFTEDRASPSGRSDTSGKFRNYTRCIDFIRVN